MFILYAVLIGVALGVLLGGDTTRLSHIRFHWKPVVFAGLIVQVVLFSTVVSERVGDLGPLLYVASTAAVLAAVIRNARIPGLPIVALGSVGNLAAIIANGGYMPAGAAAMAALGKGVPEGYSNSAMMAHPALEMLTDIFALPRWLPLANVFSIGDVLIAVGVVWAIATAMRTRSRCVPAAAGVTRSIRDRARTHAAGAPRHLSLVVQAPGTHGPLAEPDSRRSVPPEEQKLLHR